ncbi:unnamed protein product [Urochloa humidicola]
MPLPVLPTGVVLVYMGKHGGDPAPRVPPKRISLGSSAMGKRRRRIELVGDGTGVGISVASASPFPRGALVTHRRGRVPPPPRAPPPSRRGHEPPPGSGGGRCWFWRARRNWGEGRVQVCGIRRHSRLEKTRGTARRGSSAEPWGTRRSRPFARRRERRL